MKKTDFSPIINEGKLPWIDDAHMKDHQGCMRTFSGRYVNPLNLNMDDVVIEDIAHHLSLICRYTGACPDHYSVAQHSVFAMLGAAEQGVASPRILLAVLLHDSAEAYFNDLCSPVKNDPRMEWYRNMENGVRIAITLKFGGAISRYSENVIEDLDGAAFRDECELFAGRVTNTGWLAPSQAEDMFIAYFNDLQEKIRNETNPAD